MVSIGAMWVMEGHVGIARWVLGHGGSWKGSVCPGGTACAGRARWVLQEHGGSWGHDGSCRGTVDPRGKVGPGWARYVSVGTVSPGG